MRDKQYKTLKLFIFKMIDVSFESFLDCKLSSEEHDKTFVRLTQLYNLWIEKGFIVASQPIQKILSFVNEEV